MIGHAVLWQAIATALQRRCDELTGRAEHMAELYWDDAACDRPPLTDEQRRDAWHALLAAAPSLPQFVREPEDRWTDDDRCPGQAWHETESAALGLCGFADDLRRIRANADRARPVLQWAIAEQLVTADQAQHLLAGVLNGSTLCSDR